MNKLLLLILIPVVFVFSSCKEEMEVATVGDLEINFTAKYEENPLVMFQEYVFPESALNIRFKKFQFYLSDITLLHEGSSDETLLKDIELLDFTDHEDEATALNGTGRKYRSIPTGTYNGIRMGIGVSRELNERNTEYSLDHPLGRNFWEGWASYIFAKIEGNMDTNADGVYDSTISGENFVLHTGSNTVYQTVTFSSPITITEGNSLVEKISIDVKELFINDQAAVYDIINENTTHNPDNLDAGLFLMENFSRAMEME